MKNVQQDQGFDSLDLKKHDIFKGLTDAEVEKLTQSMVCNIYRRGSIIYNEGSRINGSYIVCNGVLKIYKTGFDGDGGCQDGNFNRVGYGISSNDSRDVNRCAHRWYCCYNTSHHQERETQGRNALRSFPWYRSDSGLGCSRRCHQSR